MTKIKISEPKPNFWSKLFNIAAKSNRSYFDLLKEIIRLKLGRGQLSFDEYIKWQLYDNVLYHNVDKEAFAGLKAMRKIWMETNYQTNFHGLANNKIATDIYLGMYGLPVPSTIGVFQDRLKKRSPLVLCNEEELRAFLTKEEHYPFFGKPVNGYQSLGSVSAGSYDAVHRCVVTVTGHKIPLDTFIFYIRAHSTLGYLFQKRIRPHNAVREICGDRLATVRFLTITTKEGPQVLSACWKIPAGDNTADNFWRAGNLLAQIDPKNGQVLRVISRGKESIEEVTHHPDTGMVIKGMTVPNWQEMTCLALEATAVVEEAALIGWDIAPVDSGGVIVELNANPDFGLHQLAEKRGMLDAAFMHFWTERKKLAANWQQRKKNETGVVVELVPSASIPAHATKVITLVNP